MPPVDVVHKTFIASQGASQPPKKEKENVSYKSLAQAIASGETTMKEYVSDIRRHARKAPHQKNSKSLRQCIWRDFLGQDGHYNRDELVQLLEEYLPSSKIVGYPDQTRYLVNFGEKQMKIVLDILGLEYDEYDDIDDIDRNPPPKIVPNPRLSSYSTKLVHIGDQAFQ